VTLDTEKAAEFRDEYNRSVVSIRLMKRSGGQIHCEITVRSGVWTGTFNASFFAGELRQFAEQVELLYRNLSGTAELKPQVPYLELTLKANGRGHIGVEGKAQASFPMGAELSFRFNTDQTFLPQVAHSFAELDYPARDSAAEE
jgi:hypothetical protein